LTGTNRAVVCFYYQPGTAEQRIKEGKAPTQLTGSRRRQGEGFEVAQRTKEAVHDDLRTSPTLPGGSAISKASTSERLAY